MGWLLLLCPSDEAFAQRHVTDDPLPIGFKQDPFNPPIFLTDFGTIHIETIGTFLSSPER